MTTKTIENNKRTQRKWTRWDARGILTPFEKQKLKDGTWKYDRHVKFKVKLKTTKALYDLPLILSRLGPMDFLSETFYAKNAVEVFKRWLAILIFYYYKLEEHRILKERAQKKLKLKVSSREVWKRVNKTLRETKKEVERMKEGQT